MASARRERLGVGDYAVGPTDLAVALLDATIVRVLDSGERLTARIVETEAYCGPEDKAAHSVGWRRTARTEPMFGPGGTSYVFLTYGMHCCFNVVCGEADNPVAVLVRAAEPIEGIEIMRRLRERTVRGHVRKTPLRDRDLCSGPGRLCHALAIDRGLNGIDLATHPRVWIERRAAEPDPDDVVNTTRVGVDYAGAWAAARLRWYRASSIHVSVR